METLHFQWLGLNLTKELGQKKNKSVELRFFQARIDLVPRAIHSFTVKQLLEHFNLKFSCYHKLLRKSWHHKFVF